MEMTFLAQPSEIAEMGSIEGLREVGSQLSKREDRWAQWDLSNKLKMGKNWILKNIHSIFSKLQAAPVILKRARTRTKIRGHLPNDKRN